MTTTRTSRPQATLTSTLTAAFITLLASACSTPTDVPPTTAAQVPVSRPGSSNLRGYLETADLPDSTRLVGAPPAPGSAAYALDEDVYRTMKSLRDTPRGALATQDANLRFPAAADAFACTLGVPITEEQTPHTTMLLRRSLSDAGGATYAAKIKYQRSRPFVVYKDSICTPEGEARIAKDGSYPSGHSATGWAWGLILAELAPERAEALVARGEAFGQSRLICGVHWNSDVIAGRTVASATVARLHANPVFTAQMALAREEIKAARAKGLVPKGDCAAEAAALALGTLGK